MSLIPRGEVAPAVARPTVATGDELAFKLIGEPGELEGVLPDELGDAVVDCDWGELAVPTGDVVPGGESWDMELLAVNNACKLDTGMQLFVAMINETEISVCTELGRNRSHCFDKCV